MRVIDGFDEPVLTVVVSPDGRFLAAGDESTFTLWDWASGSRLASHPLACEQLAFSPDGAWLAVGGENEVRFFPTDGRPPKQPESPGGRVPMAGGVAFAPNGKHIVASLARERRAYDRFPHIRYPGGLARWEAPIWRSAPGIVDWPEFPSLVFSPDGQFLAGINSRLCEVRFAVSGGIQCRVLARQRGRPWASFAPDSLTAICGWDNEVHIIDPVAGRVLQVVRPPGPPFRDAAYTGSGGNVGTVDDLGVLRLWEPTTWRIMTEYDWGAGALTCLAFTADGLAGVCGTARGQLVLFDLE